jgi:hypothetical protein
MSQNRKQTLRTARKLGVGERERIAVGRAGFRRCKGRQLTETHHGSRGLLALAAVLAFALLAFEAQGAEPVPKIGFLGMDSGLQFAFMLK